jgi:aspartyl/glutamyl-tRNA(Asn/Gln) amidotransferase C subunit
LSGYWLWGIWDETTDKQRGTQNRDGLEKREENCFGEGERKGGEWYTHSLVEKVQGSDMSEEITRELFAKLVELAALELDEEEGEYIRAQLNSQLSAISELEAVPLKADTPPAAHGVTYTPDTSAPARVDKHDGYKNPDEILAGAPQEEDRYFITPEIPHEDLD